MRWILLTLAIAGCAGAQCPEPVAARAAPTPPAAEPERRPAPSPNPPSGSIQVHPVRLEAEPMGGGVIMILADEEGRRQLPVVIGEAEAHVIDLRMRGETFERPLTHDLLSTMIERLGARVLFVHVDKLESNVFVGSVVLWDGHDLQTFDSRTSDAVAIGLGHHAPIYVAPAVFERAADPFRGP